MNNKLTLRVLTLVLALAISLSALTSCDLDIEGIFGSVVGSSTSTTTQKRDDYINYPSDHSDVDNNGYCDDCGIYVIETVDFYSINDLHGKLDDTDAQPGVDEMTTYLENMRESDDHTVFISAGDMWQGSSESNLTRGSIITDWMNYLGFDAMTVGNHEFDWGTDHIAANGAVAEFPILAINIYEKGTNELVDWCQPSVLIDRGNCQIGIIGSVGDIRSSISAEYTTGVDFKIGNELTELVKAESDSLRAQGADVIIYVTHAGAESSLSGTVADWKISDYYDISLSDGYVDVVFEAHSHQRYVFKDSWGVYHLQGGGDNKTGFSHVEMDINFANGELEVNVAETVKHEKYQSLDASPIVDQLLEKYWDEISEAYSVIGYNSKYRGSDEITDLVARLYYEAGAAKWGDDYDIVLGGGFLSLRSPYKIYQGDVKYSDIQMILPFENRLVLASISGRDLLDKFYNTNNDRYHIYYDSVSASDIDPKATYYIITDTYTSQYSWNNITEIEYYDNETFAYTLLIKYIQNGGWSK